MESHPVSYYYYDKLGVLRGADNVLNNLKSFRDLFHAMLLFCVFNYLYKSKTTSSLDSAPCISINHIIISEEMCESIQMAGIFPPPFSPKSFALGAIESVMEV